MAKSDRDYELQYEKRLRALGQSIEHLERASLPATAGDVLLYEIRFKLDADQGTSVLAIVRGLRDEEAVVGFCGSLDLPTCVLTLAKKVARETMRWREDLPWTGGD
jgi:hypothetical protein